MDRPTFAELETRTTMLTPADEELLPVLSLRSRVASTRQIARLWNQAPISGPVILRLKRLRTMGLLGEARATAIELPELLGPLVSWSPGEWVPEFGAVAWILRKRWQCEPAPVVLYYATTRCAQLYGGRRSGFPSCAAHISHDLGVTEMFLAIKRDAPHLLKLWVDENRLAPYRRGQKLPDAVLADSPSSVPLRVLEFGGRYGKTRLRDFHDDCEERGLPYEIW